MTERQKIAHLLRRFGLGATPEEVSEGLKLGLDPTIKRLIEFQSTPDGFNISPWSFCHEEGKEELYLDGYRFAAWWGVKMCMTQRPLQEKLALFWHDHFAVSGSKVELGPMMLDYLETIQQHCAGNFKTLLHEVSKTPAMIYYLDTQTNLKGHPNENFAREVMELFTLGIGKYTEKDIQEASRAFTGWGLRLLILEAGAENRRDIAKECIRNGNPMVAFAYSPKLHDDSPKTISGQTKNWTGEEVLDMLADRPETASHICKKLWEWFAYPNPEPAIVERLAKAFTENKLDIKAVLYAIAHSPEFYSDKCYRALVKNPVEYHVALVRQLGVGPFLQALHPRSHPMTPIEKPIRDIAGLVVGFGFQHGMLLLFPPNVSGWDTGTAWITSETMTHKMKLGPLLMGVESKDYGGAGALLGRIGAQGVPTSVSDLVAKLLAVLDAELPPAKVKLLEEAFAKHGGLASLSSAEKASPGLAAMLGLLLPSPEFQMM